ncbi:MAG TPA: sigma-70 family RNA polymerase sigma factor [Tepidiformaceae bacterium]|nr:sigma-70 family RNA polymerase sigma factor [Tepidiformaceae bacterium]
MSAYVLSLDAGLGRLLLAVRGDIPDQEDRETPSLEITRLRGREPGAWRELFEDEMPRIYRYVASRVGTEEAEDLTSQVFEAAWQSVGGLKDRGLPARAWLFGIARNVVNNHRRRFFSRPVELTLEGWDAPTAAMDPERLDLAQAVRRLPRRHAEVVVLRFVHGLSLEETAGVLGASVDGVKGRQARALAELRTMLAGEQPAAARMQKPLSPVREERGRG